MTFEQESTKTPESIGRMTITLMTEPPDHQEAEYDLVIGFDDGSTTTKRGGLIPHITPAERTALMGFMDTLRARAESEILPE